tara:strand:+ start:135 stop:857 length:723 start_codon:yes stop_codon:yes gene_type:complete
MNFWKNAQQNEKDIWLNARKESFVSLKKRAEIMFNYIYLDNEITPENIDVLEIGAAAAPIITLLPFKSRYAIDPIFDDIKDTIDESFSPKKNDKVYSKPAEDMSFIQDKKINTVFCLNVLDHTQQPEKILTEIHRIMKSDGRALISVDFFSSIWLLLRSIRVIFTGKNKNDILHPHHFTLSNLVSMLEKSGFKLERGFVAPGDGFSKSSFYSSSSEYPFKNNLTAKLKSAARFYVVVSKN